jgi:hypothetical protein
MPGAAMANKSPYRVGPAVSGTDTPKTEEDLTAQVDGVNIDFTISESFSATSIDVYYNGIKQRKPNEFTVESATEIQTTFTPSAASTLTVAYYPS